MKRFLLMLMLFSFVFIGCDDLDNKDSNDDKNIYKQTTLTIKNESSHIISTLRWNGQLFAVQPIILLPGSNTTEYVNQGSGYITFAFYRPDTGFADMGVYTYGFRTQAPLVIEEGKNSEFTFINDTLIVDEDGEMDTLNNHAKKIATLSIQNETSFRLNGISWNNCNYTTAPNGSYLEPETSAHRRWSNLHFSGANLPVKIRIGGNDYLTEEIVTVGKWDKIEFVFRADTIVVDQNNNKDELGNVFNE